MARTSMAAMLLWWAAAGCAVSPEGRQLLHSANAAYRRGDAALMVRDAERFLAMHPRVPEAAEAYYLRGLARCRQGRAAEAKPDLAAAVAASKRDDLTAQAHAKLGELAYAAGNGPEARRHYEAVLKHGRNGAPPCDQAMYRLGCMFQNEGRWREADRMLCRLRHLFVNTDLARRAQTRVGAKFWSVQAGAFTAPDSADALCERLSRASLPARVDLAVRDGKLMRLVRVGAYPTYAAVQPALARVRRLEPEAFATPAQ